MQSQPLGKILIVDDDEGILLAAKMLLKNLAESVTTEYNPKKIPYHLSNFSFDVILLDMNFSQDTFSGEEGFYWLNEILKINPKAVVILITAYGDVEMAVNALKHGATDFVLKPWLNEKLIATISAACKLSNSYKEIASVVKINQSLSSQFNDTVPEMIGNSSEMKKVFATIEKVACTDANILILGENGTGKELVAKAIHQKSLRNAMAFVNVDIGSLAETIFESELFGHKKGAFTDAKDDRIGRFEAAHMGTLFLDEIGNISMPMQAKLLTAIQKKEIVRMGTNTPIKTDIRLICATNISLSDLADNTKFRQDLLYRINTVEIHLPPLRERKSDIPLLVHYFLRKFSRRYKKNEVQIDADAQLLLEKHSWKGNIRELEHTLERAIIMSDNHLLTANDFFFIGENPKNLESNSINSFKLDEMEKKMIENVIEKNSGNISKAAKELGLTRAALYRRLEKYGI